MNFLKKFLNFCLTFFKNFFIQDTIIISSNSSYRYGGGPRYLYEYLTKKKYQIYWWTESKQVKKFLNKKKFKFISVKNPINFLLRLLKCKIVINSGNGHFDFCNVLRDDKNVFKISTMHGSGPKLVNEKFNNSKVEAKFLKKLQNFNLVSFCSEYSKRKVGIKQLKLNNNQVKVIGNPKNDIFFKEKKLSLVRKKKKYLKKILNKKKINEKIIYYAPTWRPYNLALPLLKLKNFKLQEFNNFLRMNNFLFVYSYHVQSNSKKIKNLSNFIELPFNQHHTIDNNIILIESDYLITDCGTLITEASLLKIPLLSIFPDFKKFSKKRGFVEDFLKVFPGSFVTGYNQLKKEILYFQNKTFFRRRYNFKRLKYLAKYYDLSLSNSCILYKRVIDQIL